MLYYFFGEYLSQYISWLNVFRYQSFRSLMAFIVSFLIVLISQPIFISFLQKKSISGQPIRDDGPQNHNTKKGTPTMGGLVVICAILICGLLFTNLKNLHVWICLFTLVSFAVLGFFDDWSKISKQNAKGITEKQKLLWQTFLSSICAFFLFYSHVSTDLSLPFFKDIVIPLSIFFIPFVAFVIIATSNAVNITDGLDGLAIGPIMTSAATIGIITYIVGHKEHSAYLYLSHVPYAGEVCILLAALIAGGLGFLWYNSFPAQVFMGDTGALALGAFLAVAAVIAKQELLLPLVGGIFVIEAMSVLIQRYYYKMTKKRVFKMAPIHHHFELKGWVEPKIIVRFWIISILFSVVALSTLKLR